MDPLYPFLLPGYAVTVALEAPVLLLGLSREHSWRRRLFAGFWLTACTYPVVVLVIPSFLSPDTARLPYLLAAETFAPLAECALFGAAFHRGVKPRARARDRLVILLANLLSFAAGELFGGALFPQ